MKERGIDVRGLTTEASADDLDALRAAIERAERRLDRLRAGEWPRAARRAKPGQRGRFPVAGARGL